MKIRKANVKDIPHLVKLEKEFYENDLRGLVKRMSLSTFQDIDLKNAKKDLIKHCKEHIRKRNEILLVADDGDKIIAFLLGSIKKRPSIFKLKKVGHLDELYVSRKRRGKGISSKLRNEFFKWLKKKKIKYVNLDVIILNKKAIKIYKKWGFKGHLMDMVRRL